MAAVETALVQGNLRTAALLVKEAETQPTDDAGLPLTIARCKAMISRCEWLEAALEAARRNVEQDRFADAMGHYREALTLSQGFTQLRASADRAAEEFSKKLIPYNWRVAEAILEEAAATEPSFKPDLELQERLRSAREDEAVTNAIHQADRAGLAGKPEEARQRLKQLLAEHPDDNRLKERLYALDHPGETAKPRVQDSPAPWEVARAQQTKASPQAPEDGYLDEGSEGALAAESTLSGFKNFAALAATTCMLGIAGFLIWQHFSQPYAKKVSTAASIRKVERTAETREARPLNPPSVPLPPIKNSMPPDEEAWQLVKTSNNAKFLRAFLSTYPTSSHAVRVKLKLASLIWENVEKTNEAQIKGYLRSHPNSIYSAEAQRLLSELEPKKLASGTASDREIILRVVKAYRGEGPEPWLDRSDGVTDEPTIEGDHARVHYHANGNAGGVIDQTFSLMRQDGEWKVQGVR